MLDSDTDRRIAQLGYKLPAVPAPLASYTSFVRTGNLVFLSGHVPFKEDMKTLHAGKVGVDYTTAEAAKVAESVGLALISTLRANIKDLDRIVRIVKLVGFVRSAKKLSLPPTLQRHALIPTYPPVPRV